MAGMYTLNDLLQLAEAEGAEELRLDPGRPPEMLVGGRVRVLDLPPLTGDEVVSLFGTIAPAERLEELSRCGDVRFSFVFRHSARYRVTASLKSQSGMSLNLRRISQ